MTLKKLLWTLPVCLLPVTLLGQGRGVPPAELLKPLSDSWPTYSGDYSGKRFSPLKQIDQTTVKRLSLAWVAKLTAGAGNGGGFGGGRFNRGGGGASVIIGGDGPADFPAVPANIKGTPLMVDGTLYVTTPDNTWAMDARDGRELWHYFWRTKGSTPIANRGVGIWNDYLYFVTPDNYFVSLEAKTGKERWRKVHADFSQQYFSTMAPIVIGNHVIVGTGNPIPAYTKGRGEGDNLFSCSLIAVNVDTGKMAWYFQTSPHDMHDWDSAQTPVLIDTVIDGKPRKLVSTAARNGVFFTVDRITGKPLVSLTYGKSSNWVQSVDKKGSVRRDPAKDPTVPGSLTSPTSGGTVNWEPPAYSPDTGLFYVYERNGYSIYYLTDPDPRGSMGLGGKEEVSVGTGGSFLTAIDPKTGKPAWRRPFVGDGGGGGGLLATAGKLVFTGDGAGNLVAYDAVTGKPLWHSRIGQISNAPITYMLDGRQHLLAASGDTLYAFALYE